jgi:hypothetical protein
MTLKEVDISKRHHQCAACHVVAPWGPSWSWYGSVADLEGSTIRNIKPKPIIKTCSEQCRANAKRLGLIPRNASMEIQEDL